MAKADLRLRNRRLFLALIGLTAGMAGLAYASVPLYRLFCQVTGYGGTPRQAAVAPGAVYDRKITVTFTGDVAGGLGWRFQPEQRNLTLKVGENKLAFYVAQNLEAAPVTGRAAFNVSPEVFGQYFTKIDCFCFKEQTLRPGERVEMPVSFYIDPAILDDPILSGINNVTLSYTFFRSDSQAPADAQQLGSADQADSAIVN
jgi:cytochrome c oxidase assembly protein subunit 11